MTHTRRKLSIAIRDARPIWAPPAWVLEEIRARLTPGWNLCVVNAAGDGRGDGAGVSSEALDAVHGAEIHIGTGFPREMLLEAMKPPAALRWVHTLSAGVASVLTPEL